MLLALIVMSLTGADSTLVWRSTHVTMGTAAYVYILRCRDGSLYTGWTDDLRRRLDAHLAGKASKYTRSRLPVRLAAWFALSDASAARSLEARFKQLTRREKLQALAARQAFGIAMHKGRAL